LWFGERRSRCGSAGQLRPGTLPSLHGLMHNPRLAIYQSWILHEAIAAKHDVVLSPILNQADPKGIIGFLGPRT